MRPRNRRHRILTLLAIASVVTVSIAASAATAASQPASPPKGIYTCDWIASHPAAAAAARVTCDPALFFAAMSSDVTEAPVSLMATGCEDIPGRGNRVGQGVWAWSEYKYARVWQIKGNYSPADYTWYLKKTDNTTQVWDHVTDTSTQSVGVPTNIYRMGAQNHSGTPQNWKVCYSD